MSRHLCESVVDLLVPYADGELFGDDARRVVAHLDQCPACRGELERLQRSLELVRAVWREDADAPAVSSVRRRSPLPVAVALATCAAVLLAAMAWICLCDGSEPNAGQVAQNGHTADDPPVEDTPIEDIDIEAFIARQERSARLAASIELMAAQPGLDKYKDQAERYLAETYGGAESPGPADHSPPPSIEEPQS